MRILDPTAGQAQDIGMTDATGHAVALLHLIDAKLDRCRRAALIYATAAADRGPADERYVRLEVLEAFGSEVSRIDRRIDDHVRRLTQVEDVTILADPPASRGAGLVPNEA